jgi:hypothetical protein
MIHAGELSRASKRKIARAMLTCVASYARSVGPLPLGAPESDAFQRFHRIRVLIAAIFSLVSDAPNTFPADCRQKFLAMFSAGGNITNNAALGGRFPTFGTAFDSSIFRAGL